MTAEGSGRRGPRTLSGRLALSATAVGALAVLLLTVAFSLLLERRLGAEAEDVLRSRTESAAATVSVGSGGRLVVADSEQDSALDAGVWIYEGSTAVERPAGASALQSVADSLVGTDNELLKTKGPRATAFLSAAVRDGGRQVGTVVAAVSLSPYHRSSQVSLIGAIVLALLLVVLLYFVAKAVAVRALRPVAEMTQQAGKWSAGDTSLRFGSGSRPGELEALAGTLDALLDRLSAVLRREQQLSAEISHELRTPLAGITAEADLFQSRARTPEQAQAAMATVGEGARRMERILDTLLTAARAEVATGRSDPVAVAEETASPVEVVGQVPFVGANEAVVERVLAPLLENAHRYGGEVRIRISADAAGVLLEVLDDGPGVPAGAEESVFEPGRRLDPGDGHPGAGLGLALARRLARAAGGDLTCSAGPGGRFLVTLPRA
ncbi:MAG: Histidine kinase [Frankiales bacterium]|nr:Histidine kinase [Frankiales bacterium]